MRLLVVVRELEPRRVVEQPGVEAALELGRALRLERLIPEGGEVDARLVR